MTPFLALITPIGGEDTFPKPMPTPPVYPSHPIAPGGGGPVDPGWGYRPPVDPGYGRPSWGPVDPGYGHGGGFRPDQGLPGAPVYPSQGPIYGGGHPSHPIYHPDKPTPAPEPPGGWGPGGPPTKPSTPPEYLFCWVPGYGWVWVPLGVPPGETKPVDPAEPKPV